MPTLLLPPYHWFTIIEVTSIAGDSEYAQEPRTPIPLAGTVRFPAARAPSEHQCAITLLGVLGQCTDYEIEVVAHWGAVPGCFRTNFLVSDRT